MDLPAIQTKWLEKHNQMKASFPRRSCFLAAPFFSVYDKPPDQKEVRPILLLGKATAGNWELSKYEAAKNLPLVERIEERRNATRERLGNMRNKPSSPFWKFWRQLQNQTGAPVIWSNLVKIGVIHGNPKGSFLDIQSDLACETLRVEIAEYKPRLIVIACDYAKEKIVYPIWPQKSWTHEEADGRCWIAGTDETPSVLWTDHPQFKRREKIQTWLDHAKKLFESSRS